MTVSCPHNIPLIRRFVCFFHPSVCRPSDCMSSWSKRSHIIPVREGIDMTYESHVTPPVQVRYIYWSRSLEANFIIGKPFYWLLYTTTCFKLATLLHGHSRAWLLSCGVLIFFFFFIYQVTSLLVKATWNALVLPRRTCSPWVTELPVGVLLDCWGSLCAYRLLVFCAHFLLYCQRI